jgi:hypothetical protein
MGRQEAALVVEVARPLSDLPRSMARYVGVERAYPAIVGACRAILSRAPPRHRRELETAITTARLNRAEADALIVVNAIFELYRIGGCSSLLVEPEQSATAEMLFGRNLDFPSFGHLDRLALLTVYRPEDRNAFASVGFPAFGGVATGMNEKGLAVAAHVVGRSADGSPAINFLGTPLFPTLRRVLEECGTVEEAEKLLAGSRYISPLLVVACDRRRAVVFEITTKQIVTRKAEGHLLACTNHYRTPELAVPTHCRRYRILQKYLGTRRSLSLSDVAGAMREVGVARTLQTMVFEPQSLRVHLAIGRCPVLRKRPATLDLAELFRHEVPAD